MPIPYSSLSTTFRQAFTRAGSAVLDFMHGGLLLLGLSFSLVLAAVLAGNPTATSILRSIQTALADTPAAAAPLETAAQVTVAQVGEPEAAPAAGVSPLPAGMRSALDYVARRHRVSPEALVPVFETAFTTGKRLQIDPLLIIAIISVESGFNPHSQSVMGALGLMQVIPRFHLDKLPENADATALLDPVTNVRVGAQVLRESIARNGDLITGLQQFAGALNDERQSYANKVLAEKERLELATRRGGRSVNG